MGSSSWKWTQYFWVAIHASGKCCKIKQSKLDIKYLAYHTVFVRSGAAIVAKVVFILVNVLGGKEHS